MPEFWTTKEAADYLNVPEATLRWWRYRGVGPPSFKLGPRRVMYRRADVEVWLRQQYEASGRGGG
jgi:hypothetical protein